MDELATTIGRNLRSTRLGLGLTQQDVAERAELSTEFYARMERGGTLPSVPTLVRLGSELRVGLDALVAPQKSSVQSKPATRAKDEPQQIEERRLLRHLKRARPQTLRLLRLMVVALEGKQRGG